MFSLSIYHTILHFFFFTAKVDCKWSAWGQWSQCSKNCGPGEQDQKRTKATNAQQGGKECVGSSTQTRPCSKGKCIGIIHSTSLQGDLNYQVILSIETWQVTSNL